jgi:hypothetical protein
MALRGEVVLANAIPLYPQTHGGSIARRRTPRLNLTDVSVHGRERDP